MPTMWREDLKQISKLHKLIRKGTCVIACASFFSLLKLNIEFPSA